MELRTLNPSVGSTFGTQTTRHPASLLVFSNTKNFTLIGVVPSGPLVDGSHPKQHDFLFAYSENFFNGRKGETIILSGLDFKGGLHIWLLWHWAYRRVELVTFQSVHMACV